MHTIALVSQKGGSGKSTLAIGLAIAAMQDGHKVCVLEADPQGTISNWRRRREQSEPAVEPVSADALDYKIPFLDRCGVTLAIIDTAAGHSADTEAAIRVADLCLIPSRPSLVDIESTVPTLTAIRDSEKPFAFVLNQTPVRSYRINDAAASLADTATSLSAAGVLALPYIVLRNDQQDALGKGMSVNEFALGSKSAEEISGLWRWVWQKLTATEPVIEQPLPANRETDLQASA
jgi:chromosome partitioning protein